MKILLIKTIFLIFGLIWYSNGSKISKVEIASSALSDIVNILHEQKYTKSMRIHIIGEDPKLLQIANKVMQKSKISITLKVWRNSTNVTVVLDSLMIVLCNESVKLLDVTVPEFFRDVYKAKVITYDISDDRTREYTTTTSFNIDYLYELRHSADDDSMYFFKVLYNRNKIGNCDGNFQLYNIFHASSNMSWEHQNFIQKSVKDNCKITIHYDVDLASSNPIGHERFKLEYWLKFFQNFLSELSNQYGNELEYILNKTDRPKARMVIPLLPTNRIGNLTRYAVLSPPIVYDYFTFIVTRGRPYTPMEKMFLPFDDWTWILIVLTFFIGYLTILLIYQFTREVQWFVFGAHNRAPSMTLAQIFFGIGVESSRVPSRNFARFLFMAFTLYCLVIRTAYQGKMFDFMNLDVRFPTARTVQEMRDMNVPIITRDDGSYEHWLEGEPLAKVVDDDELNVMMQQQSEFENQSYALMKTRFVVDKLVASDRNFETETKHKLIDDNYDEINMGLIYKSPRSHLKEFAETFIERCHEHGLMEKFKPIDIKFQKKPIEPEDTKKILTMQILSAGFYLWLGVVALSCIVFIGEHFVYWISTRKNGKVTNQMQQRRHVTVIEEFNLDCCDDGDEENSHNEQTPVHFIQNDREIDEISSNDEADNNSHHALQTVTVDVHKLTIDEGDAKENSTADDDDQPHHQVRNDEEMRILIQEDSATIEQKNFDEIILIKEWED